jgi:hypothetical protein
MSIKMWRGSLPANAVIFVIIATMIVPKRRLSASHWTTTCRPVLGTASFAEREIDHHHVAAIDLHGRYSPLRAVRCRVSFGHGPIFVVQDLGCQCRKLIRVAWREVRT